MLPRIGITGSIAPSRIGTRRTFLNEPYLDAVREAGGVPLVLTPAHTGASLRALYELLDGLILSGGEDVVPARYGVETPHPSVEVVPERDALEFQLLEWALADGLPVLAICRGLQVLNVALGGTLYQDLPSERPEHPTHNQMQIEPPVPRPDPHHRVNIAGGSSLAELVDAAALEVNSMHHQAIRDLAPDLAPVAHAPDGLIEAVEPADPARFPFLIGIQWHPEELLRRGDGAARRLFEGLVAAASKRIAR